MKKLGRFTSFFLAFVLLMAGVACAAEATNETLGEPSIEYWPELRWWLAAGSHTDETLLREIDLIYESGFGAVEFLAMPEAGLDYSLYGWGSEEWVHDSMLIIERCTELGMGVSLTSGTHWANANLPNIVPDDKEASKTLSHTEERLAAGQAREGNLIKYDGLPEGATAQELIAVVAAKVVRDDVDDDGYNTAVLDMDSLSDITGLATAEGDEYTLAWEAPDDGDYTILTFWLHGTAQSSEPSIGTNYCVNYMDSYGIQAVMDYWTETILTDELTAVIEENGRVQLYMDSLEISANGSTGLLWGYDFLDEFESRRGYDLTPYLPLMMATQGSWMSSSNTYPFIVESDDALVDKIRNDMYETMTEMYTDNVLAPLA